MKKPRADKARERKLAAKRASANAVKKSKGRRSGRVVTYTDKSVKTKPKLRKSQIEAFRPKMGKPKGLSARARFDMLRPDCVSPHDWWQLFTDDEEIWPGIVEEAVYEVESGHMKRYPDDAPANVSRRKLRELQGLQDDQPDAD